MGMFVLGKGLAAQVVLISNPHPVLPVLVMNSNSSSHVLGRKRVDIMVFKIHTAQLSCQGKISENTRAPSVRGWLEAALFQRGEGIHPKCHRQRKAEPTTGRERLLCLEKYPKMELLSRTNKNAYKSMIKMQTTQ